MLQVVEANGKGGALSTVVVVVVASVSHHQFAGIRRCKLRIFGPVHFVLALCNAGLHQCLPGTKTLLLVSIVRYLFDVMHRTIFHILA